MELSSSRERMLRKQKKREKSSSDKSQGVKEARFRKARKLLKNAIAQVRIIIFQNYTVFYLKKK